MTGPRPDEPQREILTVDEAAQLLGVSLKTFQKVLREGEVPGRKIGREWKFSRRALIAWVAAGRSAEFLDVDDVGEGGRSDADGRPAPAPRALRDVTQLRAPSVPHLHSTPAAPTKKRADHEMAFEED
jgi:excisionase family DNA binding protein